MVDNYTIERRKKLEPKPPTEEETPQQNQQVVFVEPSGKNWSALIVGGSHPATSLVNYVRSYDPDQVSDGKFHHYDLQASCSVLTEVDLSLLHFRRWKITFLPVETDLRPDNRNGNLRFCCSDVLFVNGVGVIPRHVWICHCIYSPPVSKSPKSLL